MLIGKLIDLAIGAGGEGQPDEILKVEIGVGHIRPLARHPVGQVARLLIAPVGADQVTIVDIGVIDILARLHLGLQLFHHITFTNQVMGDLDAGNRGKGRGQNLGFVRMGVDGLGHHLDLHARQRSGGINEPLHLGLLIGAAER